MAGDFTHTLTSFCCCAAGISLELEQGSFSITAMLEHVNLLIGITQPAATGSGSAFNG